MEKLAHKSADGRTQLLSEHLRNVSTLAESFAAEPFKQLAAAAGAAHDIGKNAPAFQKRLDGSKERFEHSACGAIEINAADYECRNPDIIKPLLEYCVAGHHTGLPDGGSIGDNSSNATLQARLKRKEEYVGSKDYHGSEPYMKLSLPDQQDFIKLLSSKDNNTTIEKYAFFTRYVFSCLTDADFLDTENFCNVNTDRKTAGDVDAMLEAVNKRLSSFKAATKLQKSRARLQQQAISNLDHDAHISILNMPTGSGKTLCSLKLALEMVKHSQGNLKRIIYVIPYTSIVEQTANTFEELLGDHADVLQHHSNYIYDDSDDNDSTSSKLKKACENWDAPIVITTSVQFFESLYHYKSSRLRKLHNIAQSVIVFDEIHLLPIDLLQPCLKGVGYLTEYLGSKALFLSATMPDHKMLFEKYIPQCRINELIKDRSDMECFEKCSYTDLGMQELESIAERANGIKSSLIVVNSRKSARQVYSMLSGNKYHLSTYMTAHDRSCAIERIKQDLDNDRQVCVVSTSLIEAGVDLDFEAVFRQLAGLDNILQSAGRCNREGTRPTGNVYVFSSQEKPHGDLLLRSDITEQLIEQYPAVNTKECIEEYYNRIFRFKEKTIDKNSIADKQYFGGNLRSIAFRTYADQFEFISDDTINVVISNASQTEHLLEQALTGSLTAKRKLQLYSVALKHSQLFLMLQTGRVTQHPSGLFVLTDPNDYDSSTGLMLERTNDIIFD